MKLFSLSLMLLLGVSVVGGLLFGCSPAVRENAFLEQARSAFAEAQGELVMTLDADLQDDPRL